MTQTPLRHFADTYFGRLRATLEAMPSERIDAVGEVLFQAYRHGKQVFIIGNGGSAATASHMACDLAKNVIDSNRPRFRVMSLNDNMALLSALANDVGYDAVFSEQLVNLIRPGDVLVALSASGRSTNVVAALRYARSRSATTIGLLGFDGGLAEQLSDEAITVPSDDYGIIEDVHMTLVHVFTGYFRERLDSGERFDA